MQPLPNRLQQILDDETGSCELKAAATMPSGFRFQTSLPMPLIVMGGSY